MSTPKFRMVRNVASVALALVLGTGIAGCAQGSGSAEGAAEEGPAVTLAVIGPDENGDPAYYAPEESYAVTDDADAWTITQQAFVANDLGYDAQNSDYGVFLDTINSPIDGTALGYDEATGCYWQLFVNGEASEVGISEVELSDGTSLVWYYSAFGDALPESVGTLDTLANAA